MSSPSVQALRLGYLVTEYPALSHTFISSEIRQLRAAGAEVATFSVRHQSSTLPSEYDAEARTTTVLSVQLFVLVRAALWLLATHPAGLLWGLRQAVFPQHQATISDRVIRVGYLARCCVLVKATDALELTHLHVHFSNNGAEIARLWSGIANRQRGGRPPTTWSLAVHALTMHGLDHSDAEQWPDRDAGKWGPLATKLRSAALVSCISEHSRKLLRDLVPEVDPQKFVLVRMGVDTDLFAPRTPGEPRPAGVRSLLYVGRFSVEKRPLLLLDVLELVLAKHDCILTMVGAGPLEQEIRRHCEARGLGRHVNIVGALGQAELPALYAACDLVILTSRSEGIPVVLMEAMAMGKPVVASEVDGIPELVVSGVTGLLATSGDAGSYASAVDRLLSDPMLCQSLGRAGRELVSVHHDSGAESAVLIRALQELKAGSPREDRRASWS